MKNARQYQLPKGMQNFLKEECYNKISLERDTLLECSLWGYDEVEVSPLEFYDNYLFGETHIDQRRMFKLSDTDGNLVVLSPDITLPLLRLAIKDGGESVKYCYRGNIFDNNESVHTKSRIQHQVGVEYIGEQDLRADVEVIKLAISCLKKSGLKDFQIDIGEVNFYKGIMEEHGISKSLAEEIRLLVEKKNQLGVAQLVEDKEALAVINCLPTLFGGVEVLLKAQKLCRGTKSRKALSDLEFVVASLSECGLSEYISIDLGLVQRISYYSGIVFRGLSSGFGTPIMQGGRYDELSKTFNSELAATGFAIDIKKLLICLEQASSLKNSQPIYALVVSLGDSCFTQDFLHGLHENGKRAYEIFAKTQKELKACLARKNVKTGYFIDKDNEVIEVTI